MEKQDVNVDEGLRGVIRELLKADKIKLWLAPYTAEDGFSPGSYPTPLLNRYCEVCGAAPESLLATLEALRQHAIAKLSCRHAGVAATAVVDTRENLRVTIRQDAGETKELVVSVSLAAEGSTLYEVVATAAGQSSDAFKLIHAGSTINCKKKLSEQGMCSGSAIMLLPLSQEEQRHVAAQSAEQGAARIRDAASSLTDKDYGGDGGRYLELCDHNGKPIDLPDEERRALSIALVLHQKGQRLLRRASSDRQYQDALAILMECDRQFGLCPSSSILTSVDNFAVLCLDICWCQLLLQQTDALPNAEQRLANCELFLRNSYGQNMERLAHSKKGNTGAEKLLMGRLHLLQAVVAHFTGRPSSARELLGKSRTELSSLRVNSENLAQLMALCNCGENRARVALRACGHDVQRAALYLMEQAEDQRRNDELVEERAAKRLRSRNLGKVADGSGNVDAEKYDTVCGMGFPRVLCLLALKHSNNNLSAAIAMLHDDRATLEAEAVGTFQHKLSEEALEAPAELVAQGVAMGFDEDLIRSGLKQFNMQLQPLIDHLVDGGAIGEAGAADVDRELAAALLFDPEDTDSDEDKPPGVKKKKKKKEKSEIDDVIENELLPDMDMEVTEHLDSTLEREFELLEQYTLIIQPACG